MESKFSYVNRAFNEQIEKFKKIQPEFEQKSVSVAHILEGLEDEKEKKTIAMLDAIEKLDSTKHVTIILETQDYCDAVRKEVDALAFEHLNKRYL